MRKDNDVPQWKNGIKPVLYGFYGREVGGCGGGHDYPEEASRVLDYVPRPS